MIYYVFVHNVGVHSTAILVEKMGAKQWSWNGNSSTTPSKVYHKAPFLTVCRLNWLLSIIYYTNNCCLFVARQSRKTAVSTFYFEK